MSGRAKSAPLLRRKKLEGIPAEAEEDDIELDVLDSIDVSGEVVVPEAAEHDMDIWPHLYPAKLQEAMFPTVAPVPARELVDDEALAEHSKLHRRWAATRVVITRG